MLLLSPATINDGTADLTFTFQNQIQVGKSVVQTYKNLTASVQDAHQFIVKYDASHPTLMRNVSQIVRTVAIPDGTLHRITANISLVFHKHHALADVEKVGRTACNANTEAGFWLNFYNQM